ncbi:MAG: universal stress protein UspA [Polaromonas sp.]|nr:universal stress protein UspA [Polaromonas sp.]
MNKVYACIDGLANTACVIDWAAWSALRLDVPLELLHVLERNDRPLVTDYSGAIGLGAQEALLDELSALEAQRGKLAYEAGRQMMDKARARAASAGVQQLDVRLRHGELLDSVLELEPDARLFVLGEHYQASGASKIHLDHRVERVIRSVKRPVLVATGAPFEVPQSFVIAFDGSATSRKTVETVAASPMLRGLPATVAMVGDDTTQAQRQLEDACQSLAAAGFEASMKLLPGEPEQVLPAFAKAQGASLLVMGAYGHSRIRQLIVGSMTTTLLRLSEVPVLILR